LSFANHGSEFSLPAAAWNEIRLQDEFPDEYCETMLSTDHRSRATPAQYRTTSRARSQNHPRTAAIAYNMDVKVLDSLLLEASKIGFALKAIYHSTQITMLTFRPRIVMRQPHLASRPILMVQIVVSIYDRAVKNVAFAGQASDFVPSPYPEP
jgi:hypothetical protein